MLTRHKSVTLDMSPLSLCQENIGLIKQQNSIPRLCQMKLLGKSSLYRFCCETKIAFEAVDRCWI